MAALVFDPADVRRVVEHSINAPQQREVVTGYDPNTFKPITKPVKAPALMLVHDDGVYLISNGTPPDTVDGTHSFVAYANGCNPRKDANCWDKSRALVGADDFSETLDWCYQLKNALDAGATSIVINITAKGISSRAVAKLRSRPRLTKSGRPASMASSIRSTGYFRG